MNTLRFLHAIVCLAAFAWRWDCAVEHYDIEHGPRREIEAWPIMLPI